MPAMLIKICMYNFPENRHPELVSGSYSDTVKVRC
jgi:hypothetical protein